MQARLFTLAAIALIHVGLGAQANSPLHTTLLSRFEVPGHAYNDVWGYVGPGGTEYAILGTDKGTFIVDCTNPAKPRRRGYFPGPSSGWRDMRTYRNYLYVVTEGGGGMQIIDLRDPNNPQMVKTWGRSLFSNAHNIAIDTGTGMAYPCGTNIGIPIIDLRQDPENPVHIGQYTSSYVHDLCVQDGYAHLGEINNGRYSILDMSNLPSTTRLGSSTVNKCHNAWPSRDGLVSVATTEDLAGGVSIFDISDKRLPIRTAVFFTGGFASVHNAYMKDRICHMSYYTEGYVAVDLSDPTKPRKLASFDTTALVGGSFSGAWGCYPFQPSGVIYVSDRTNGLHVVDSLASSGRYGSGTAGTGGEAPSIYSFGAAYFSNQNFKIELEHAAPNANVSLFIGVAPGSTRFAGAEVLVDLSRPVLIVNARTDASGMASINIPVGVANSATLYAQWLILDGGASSGLAASRGMKFDVFPRDQ